MNEGEERTPSLAATATMLAERVEREDNMRKESMG